MPLRAPLRWLLAVIYLGFGVLHVRHPGSFLPIMPPWVPWPTEVVMFTGICELLGGAGLLLPPVRRAAGIGLALYAVCVYPANVYHAMAWVHVAHLPDSWWYHGPRLAFQPVLVWWALYAGGLTDWPFRRRTSATQASRYRRRSTTKPLAR